MVNTTLRILASVPLWLGAAALQGLGFLAGLLVVPALVATRQFRYRKSRMYDDRLVLSFPDWAWLWNNEETGVDGIAQTILMAHALKNEAWHVSVRKLTRPARVLRWSAWEQPTGNLRFTWPMRLFIYPPCVRYVTLGGRDQHTGVSGWFIWQDAKSGLRLDYKQWRFWIGWKLMPSDVSGLAPGDDRSPGTGFALQLKRARI